MAAASKEEFLHKLEQLAGQVPAVARRRSELTLICDLIDKVAAGGIMDAIIQSTGYLNSISDCSSHNIAIVYNNGWSLGFEGEGGELVILIDYIQTLRRRRTGLEIQLESGESIYLRFHGRWAPVRE